MSLTSHLKDTRSPIRQFLQEQFPHTRSFVQNSNLDLRASDTIEPAERVPYSTIGTALDYRVRYYFAVTAPETLVAWKGAHIAQGSVMRAFLNSAGKMKLLPLDQDLNETSSVSGDIVPAFFGSFSEVLTRTQPVGRRLSPEDERILARYCIGLALFEQAFRVGRIPLGSPLIFPSPIETLSELLARIQRSWVDDLCALSYAFYDSQGELLSQPSVLNPIFDGSSDVGGADADLIVDGCLVDIKATIRPKLSASWLYQLLGYVLLDYSDQYEIHAVAIYFARQRKVLRWPLVSLINKLAGGSISPDALRAHFRRVARGEAKGPLRVFARIPKSPPERHRLRGIPKTDSAGDRHSAEQNAEEPDDSIEGEWIESAYQAGRLVGISPIRIRELGLKGSIRMMEKGSKTHYLRSDVLALAEGKSVPENEGLR